MRPTQLSLDFDQAKKCPGMYMCPDACGFALWSDPEHRLFCMICHETKYPWKETVGGEGGSPPSEGAEAP